VDEQAGALDLLVIEANPERAQALTASLASAGLTVHLLAPGGALITNPGWSGPDAMLVGLDTDPTLSLAYGRWAHDTYRQAVVLAYGGQASADTLAEAMAAGIRQVLPYPFLPEALRDAVESVRQQAREATSVQTLRARLGSIRTAPAMSMAMAGDSRTPAPTVERAHQVVAVCSPSGGVGTTTLAINLAVAIQQSGRKTVLVDANLSFGSHDVFLKLPPLRSIMQGLDEAGEVSPARLISAMIPHQCGLSVLLAPPRPEEADRLRPEHMERVLWALRADADYVVVDASPPTDPRVMSVLRLAELVVVPVGPDLPAMKNLASFLRLLSLMNNPYQRLVPVLFRADSAPAERVKALEAAIKRQIRWRIAGDEALAMEAANSGVPLVLGAPTSALGRTLISLAQYCVEGEEAAPERSRASLGRFFKR
jgi:pilus assembly protein CpaE